MKKIPKATENSTTVPDARQELARKVEMAWIPKRFHAMLKRAWNRAGPSGRDNAIRCKCYECVGFDGGSADDVRMCADATCPIWAFRPGAGTLRKKTATKKAVTK